MKEKYEFETTIVSKGGVLGKNYGNPYDTYPSDEISIDEFLKQKLEENKKYKIKIIIEK